MKQKCIFIFVIIFFSNSCYEANSQYLTLYKRSDTIKVNKSNYKLSKEMFLRIYGSNDTLKVLIEFYFLKRKNGMYKIGLLPVSASIMMGEAALYNSIGLFYLTPLFYYISFASAPISVYGFIQLLTFNRKKLLKIIKVYEAGFHIPEKTLKKISNYQLNLNSKLSRQEFIDLYDNNDTTSLLINMFFNKRSSGFYYLLSFPTSILLSAAVLGIEIGLQTRGPGDKVIILTVSPIVFVLTVIPSIFLIGKGLIQILKFSRKRLLKILLDYQKGKPIPDIYLKTFSKYQLNKDN